MAAPAAVAQQAKTLLSRTLSEEEGEILALLCDSAWEDWVQRLRPDTAVEDCQEVMALAAAWTALSRFLAALEEAQPTPRSFTAGDLRVERGEASASPQALARQAERLMAPFARDESFAFWEVRG